MYAKQKGSKRTSASAAKQAPSGKITTHVGRWSPEEHAVFVLGMQQYPKQWKKIAEMVKTRTVVQIRTHAQKCWNDSMADPRKMKEPPPETSAKSSSLSKARLVASQANSGRGDQISPKNKVSKFSTRKRKGRPGLELQMDSGRLPEQSADNAEQEEYGVGRRRRRPTAKSSALTAAAVAAAMGRHSMQGMHMGRQLFTGGHVKKEKKSHKKKQGKRPGRPRQPKVNVYDSPTGVMSFQEHRYNSIGGMDNFHESAEDQIDLQLLNMTSAATDQFITHNDLNQHAHTSMGSMISAPYHHHHHQQQQQQQQVVAHESTSPTQSVESDSTVSTTDSQHSSVSSNDSSWHLTTTTGTGTTPAVLPAAAITTTHAPSMLQLKLTPQPQMTMHIPPAVVATPHQQLLQKAPQMAQSPQVGSAAYAAKYLKSSMNLQFGMNEEEDKVLAPVPLFAHGGGNKEKELSAPMMGDDLNFFNDLLFT